MENRFFSPIRELEEAIDANVPDSERKQKVLEALHSDEDEDDDL